MKLSTKEKAKLYGGFGNWPFIDGLVNELDSFGGVDNFNRVRHLSDIKIGDIIFDMGDPSSNPDQYVFRVLSIKCSEGNGEIEYLFENETLKFSEAAELFNPIAYHEDERSIDALLFFVKNTDLIKF